MTATSTPLRRENSQQRPSLRVVEGVDGHSQRSAVVFLVFCASLLLMAIVIPLIANTNMAHIAYEMRDVSVQLSEEEAAIQTLEKKLLEQSSQSVLREKAQGIGMVPAAPLGVIVLEDGTVEGGAPAQ